MSDPSTVSRFDEIYNSTKKPVLAFITAKCASTEDAGDIFQETYMELYRVLLKRGTGYITNEKAFVMKLAKQKLSRHYKLIDRLRNVVPLVRKDGDNEEFDVSEFDVDSFLVEDFTVNKVLLESARQHIKSKPEIVKKVFYLFYNSDLTISETAQLLSISESSVKNHLYRTLKEMRELLS